MSEFVLLLLLENYEWARFSFFLIRCEYFTSGKGTSRKRTVCQKNVTSCSLPFSGLSVEWNALPEEIVCTRIRASFKTRLRKVEKKKTEVRLR